MPLAIIRQRDEGVVHGEQSSKWACFLRANSLRRPFSASEMAEWLHFLAPCRMGSIRHAGHRMWLE
jgi:hypothetical protein